MPYISIFLTIKEWLTVSKAFNKYINTPKVYRLFSEDPQISLGHIRE